MEGRCDRAYDFFAIGDTDVGDAFGQRLGQLLTHDGHSTFINGTLYIFMSVDLRTTHSHKKMTRRYTARIDMHIGNVALHIANDLFYA